MAKQPSKQLRGLDEHLVCDVCRRTMLKGERTEPYLTPSRERKLVCSLCASRAQVEGWIRESANPETTVQPPRPSERRGLFKRRRRPLGERLSPTPGEEEGVEEKAAEAKPEVPAVDGRRPGAARPPMRDPRHVRALPTNAQLKLERAIELFNASEHSRTVAGIGRTLGTPHVSATTSEQTPSEVLLTVAWELSWYQFVVDLSDTNEPVRTLGRGQELEELAPDARDWNATADEQGRITVGAVEEGAEADSNGEPADQGL